MKLKYYLLSIALVLFISVCPANANNIYFNEIDFEKETPSETMLLLKKFKPLQQTTDYTCGPVCANMVVGYYEGQPRHSELETAELMGINAYTGAMPRKIEKYFNKLGYQVQPVSKKYALKSYEDFASMVTENIAQGTPIIVESADWGNHWRVIIGIDKLDTDNPNDDVLILADPMDVADGKQDGYTVENARRFFFSWFSVGTPLRVRQGLLVSRVE